jgi:EAL domain-containing protein (putative c-di-GMP-specific phosphodiesterase class I)
MISPADFIPLAEETALIVPIGEWVLRQACAEAAKWPSDIGVAVNLSPAQFKSPHLSQIVITALARSGLSPLRLELEITESVLLFNNDNTLATLHQLRALGVRIAMDDFGTGYSSLSYLRSFPFDKIKIDQSFVHNLSDDEDSKAIIRAVTGLGTSLRMTTTGEGVETQEELDYLRNEGCTEAQGYFFSKPRPANEIPALLAKQFVAAKAVA